jgi:signal transduction histidine kinase
MAYHQARISLPQALTQVRALTADDPGQQARAARVVALSDQLVRTADESLGRERARRALARPMMNRAPPDPQQRALRDREHETLHALTALIREMTQEENRLLAGRREQARGTLHKMRTAVALVLALALVLVIVATWASATSIARRNRTERDNRQLQQIVELQASREEDARLRECWSGVLGHDLRNPLSAIRMGAAALQRRGAGEVDTRLLSRIESSAERMGRMIDQLLDFTRLRAAGGLTLERRALDLAELSRRVVDELELAHPERRLRVEAQGDTCGEWDADRLAQVLSNLVGNAIAHGGVEQPVEVHLRGGEAAVTLAVHNGGEPIPEGFRPLLFDPFRRPRGGNRSGLGLGLFITSQIVAAHGGDIAVASTDGSGTTFTVTLPRRGA